MAGDILSEERLTLLEAARELKVHVSTVHRWHLRGVRGIKLSTVVKQIEENELPEQNFAKESSSLHQWFVDRNDGDESVYELEALEPSVMLADLETVITSVLDMDMFNAEAEQEQEEATYLEAARRAAQKALEGFGQ